MAERPDPVIIAGATGYLGRHLVHYLSSRARPIRCLVRPLSASPEAVSFLEGRGARVFQYDLDKPDDIPAHVFAGARCAVHLVGSIAPRRGESLDALHAGQTARLVELCQRYAVPKVVLVTAIGAEPDARSQYHASKWQAEEIVRRSGLAHVIVRPSLIVGRLVGDRDSKLVRRYIDLIRSRAVVPLINGGITSLQPVFIGDVVRALEACIESEELIETTIEVGGPEVLTMAEFLDRLMAAIGVRKPVVGVPAFLARLAACLCAAVQEVPLVSPDQVTIALADSVCQENGLATVLSISPTPLEAALATYGPSPVRAAGLTGQKEPQA